jgi:hypothetical protein
MESIPDLELPDTADFVAFEEHAQRRIVCILRFG